MDGGAWQTTVHGIAKSQTWLTDFTSLLRNKKAHWFGPSHLPHKVKVNFMSCLNGNATKTHLGGMEMPLFPTVLGRLFTQWLPWKNQKGWSSSCPRSLRSWPHPLAIFSFHHLRSEHWEGRHCGQEWRVWLHITTQGMLTFLSEWHGSCLQVQFSSVQIHCSLVFYSLRLHGLQLSRLPSPSPTHRACSTSCTELVMPSNHLILCHPLLLLPSIFPSIRFQWVCSLYQVAKILELQLQHQSFQWAPRTDFL